jgi:hypothetical protein
VIKLFILWEYGGWGWKYSNIIIGVRGNFHYPLIDKLDTYTGLLLGCDIATSKEFGNSVPGYNYSASSGGVVYSWSGEDITILTSLTRCLSWVMG